MPLPVTRPNVGALAVVFAIVLAFDRVVDFPFFADLLAAGVVYMVARASLEHFVDELRRDDQADRRDEPVGARDARQAYVAGEIDERELEKRLDRALDPRVREIREHFDDVEGVGRAISHDLADHFGTLESIEQADADELEQIDGIGPERSKAIVEQGRNSKMHGR